jgi:hypothetical protein
MVRTGVGQIAIDLDGTSFAPPNNHEERVMKKVVFLLLFVTTASAAWADHHRFRPRSHHAGWAEPSSISCDTVRAYVSQMGFAQARAIALANGMTAAQERRARQCLAKNG